MKKMILLVLIALLILSGCAGTQERITKQSFAFDTVVSITADKKDSAHIDEALKMCNEYERIFSRTNAESELFKINNSSVENLSSHMKNVLEFSLGFSKMTGGAFDITVAPLSNLWNVNSRKEPPTQSEVKEALSSVGYERLSLSPFSLNQATLDLGAVAKGYIADKLAEYFKGKGVDNTIIDLGGNVAVLGEYTVGIRNPSSPDEVFATITLKDKSAVTSGAYQRYFEYEGKRYHHIIDPRTGYPSQSGLSSVTVISPSSMHADALSTAIFILGENALSLCEEFPDTDALIITDNGAMVTTDNFSEKYNLQIQ